MYKRTLFHTITLALSLNIFSPIYASSLATAGWVEKAILLPSGLMLHAKLDTGARVTSINATDTEFFQRDNQAWVRFSITSRNNKTSIIEAPVVREAKIKRHYGNRQLRPVILLDICIGNIRKKEEVNLVDRSNLNYQLLIGRNFLSDAFMIDSSATYELSPSCAD